MDVRRNGLRGGHSTQKWVQNLKRLLPRNWVKVETEN